MIIKNGVIANSSISFKADIKIENGIISAISQNINDNDGEIIEAEGMYVIPGGIDAHTHMDLDVGIARAVDDFYTGTVAAAFGGTTTIIDHMGFGPKGCSLSHQVGVYHKLAGEKAVIDYGFHGVIQHVNDDILNEMDELIDKEGITSYKIYLTYDYKIEDKDAFRVLEKAKENGIVITVHPENDGVVNYLKLKYKAQNRLTPEYHAKSRPLECEAEAISRMIQMAHMAGDPKLYIVHLSNALGLDIIRQAIDRGQKNIFAETCPQYLFLNEDMYKLPNNEGLKYIMSPPLRSKDNNEKLFSGIEKKYIDVIATDHCPFNFGIEKQMGKDDFTKCPNGAPGVELRLPLMFSEGVMKKRISINDFVEISCHNPAKIFGLDKKGEIAVGFDADIVIIDPNKKINISKNILHENVDYTPYEGFELQGYPVVTISRGEIIVKDNKFLGEKGRGKYIKRKIM